MVARHEVPGIMSTSRSEPVLATVQAEEQGQAVPASGEPVEARSVEAREPAASVEDRQEEKEHREFEQTWTSFSSRLSLLPDVWAERGESGTVSACRRGRRHEHFPHTPGFHLYA